MSDQDYIKLLESYLVLLYAPKSIQCEHGSIPIDDELAMILYSTLKPVFETRILDIYRSQIK